MFGLSTGELVMVLFIVLLVFGSSRLPELGRGLGQGMRGFRDALRGDQNQEKPEKHVKTNDSDINNNKSS